MIDAKIKKLREITSNFLYIEYYAHTHCDMWKINNEYTKFRLGKLVLCSLDEGIEKALDLAISGILARKLEWDRVEGNAL